MSETKTKPTPPTLADFELGEELAWGSLATIVDVVFKRNQKHYALKILNKAQLVKKKVIRSALIEKDALIALGTRPNPHQGIVRLHHCFQDNTHLYFALDLATHGDLKALVLKLGSVSLDCARFYTAQMVDAVQYLHVSGISHRDIKPENVLLDAEWRIKLCDFGCAWVGTPKDMDVSRTNTFVGTAAYISPELLERSKSHPTSPDLWAIGCTLHFFLFGASPFLAATDYLTMKRVREQDYSIPEACDANAASLIRALLVSDPTERLGVSPKSSPSKLRQHPFFVGHPTKGTDGGSQNVASSPQKRWLTVEWEALWTKPAPEIEVGPYRIKPQQPVETDDLWESFEGLEIVKE
ncbi:AGC/PDK1 protein kinase [Crepidotus variabilis]|uniref:non-specific serine/threonine protein kinase n=1 Tax=Crepidotus variabilis TaxID=179855 RepID=A0A9P6EJK8_9AGAR|nr:AGC/PDK1 protein kinase [Crepidotus variabilis]